MPGRFEIVGRDPLVVLDGAHSPEAAACVAATLRDDFHHSGETILVLGMLRPRDPASVLAALEVESTLAVIACEPPSPRAVPAGEIAAAVEALGGKPIVEPDVARAVERAKRLAAPGDAILVTGSLYVVGAARTAVVSGP
jgi:dihydrofolate synthase/folylpolyglutamate synthase